jgi:endoribonuclease Dicer
MINIFPVPPENYDFHDPDLLRCLSVISPVTWENLEVPWSSLVMRHDATLYNLGPYCASLYLYLEVRHTLQNIQMELRIGENTEMEVMEYVARPSAPKYNSTEEMNLIRDILLDFEGFFWKQGCPNTVPIPVPLIWCSSKVDALKNILLEFYTTNFQAIVFVEQRQVAACLSKILPVIPGLEGKIRSAHLVGQGVNSDGVSKATDVFHGDAIQAFRKGEANVRKCVEFCEIISLL